MGPDVIKTVSLTGGYYCTECLVYVHCYNTLHLAAIYLVTLKQNTSVTREMEMKFDEMKV